jgi:hypothetical protein
MESGQENAGELPQPEMRHIPAHFVEQHAYRLLDITEEFMDRVQNRRPTDLQIRTQTTPIRAFPLTPTRRRARFELDVMDDEGRAEARVAQRRAERRLLRQAAADGTGTGGTGGTGGTSVTGQNINPVNNLPITSSQRMNNANTFGFYHFR